MSDMGIGEAMLISSIIGGGASIAGGALKNRGQQSSTSTPTLDPKLQPLQDLVQQMVTQRLSSGSLPPGYETGGIKNINASYSGAGTALDADLTRRGLSTSPVAGTAMTKFQTSRAGDIGTFRANVPLVERQLQTEDLAGAGNLLATGRGVQSTSSVTTGGGAAGAFTNLAGYLGYLQGRGAFGRGGQTAGYPYGGTNYEGAQY